MKYFRGFCQIAGGVYLYPIGRKNGLKFDAEGLCGGNDGLRQTVFETPLCPEVKPPEF